MQISSNYVDFTSSRLDNSQNTNEEFHAIFLFFCILYAPLKYHGILGITLEYHFKIMVYDVYIKVPLNLSSAALLDHFWMFFRGRLWTHSVGCGQWEPGVIGVPSVLSLTLCVWVGNKRDRRIHSPCAHCGSWYRYKQLPGVLPATL